MIGGKYFVSQDLAVLAGFGFANVTSSYTDPFTGTTTSESTTQITFMGGIRKYLDTTDFAPFVGAAFAYESTSGTPGSTMQAMGVEAGAEYFLAKQFSLEGSVALVYASGKEGEISASYMGTTTSSVSANFYF